MMLALLTWSRLPKTCLGDMITNPTFSSHLIFTP